MARGFKRIRILMIEDGNFKAVRAFDFGDRLGMKIGSTWRVWAKGKPLLVGKLRPRYTYLVTPEVCWTLSEPDLVRMLTLENAERKERQKREGGSVPAQQLLSLARPPTGKENAPGRINAPQGQQLITAQAAGSLHPAAHLRSSGIAKEYGGLVVKEDELLSPPAPEKKEQVEGAEEEEPGLQSKDEEDAASELHTVNPSLLFDDKTQAEWFGNIVQNSEGDAMKQMVQSANKPSKFVFLLVLVAGIMIGAFMVIFFTGGIAGTGGTHPTPPSVPTFPTPTPSGSGSILGRLLALLR